jgi:uncharacterized protein (TIGR02145 family)
LLCTITMSYAQTITIGTEVWMVQNLNVEKFRNGDLIPEAKTAEEWEKAGKNKEPAWCYYNNDSANGAKYGKLYNWYAVSDLRGLAPVNWHIPDYYEWAQLVDYLTFAGNMSRIKEKYGNIFSIDSVGKKLKSSSGWKDSGNGNNESGFAAYPGGMRYEHGVFYSHGIGYSGNWWCSTEYFSINASYFNLRYRDNMIGVYDASKGNGFSVRCIKD